MTNPHERLRHHVTGAIKRGEKNAIVGTPQVPALPGMTPLGIRPSADSVRGDKDGYSRTRTPEQYNIAKAIDLLKLARNLLRRSNAPRAANAVARALKSAEGAQRHADGKAMRLYS